MQVSVETTSGLERKMTVDVPAEGLGEKINEKLQSIAKTARLNGFRPGKVPLSVVRKRYGEQVRGEVVSDMIMESMQSAMEQEKLRVAGQPRLEAFPDLESIGENLSYTAVFEVYPEFDPVYEAGVKVEKPAVTIESSDVDTMVDNLRKQRIHYHDTDRAAANDDQITIDFVGSIDGVPFEGGAAEKTPLVLGSGSMIPGFEDQLLGVVAGEEKNIKVSFPENYQAAELAGKEADFLINVHAVAEPHLPELDEETIKSFGIEDGTIESLRADIEKNMQRELDQRVNANVKQQVMSGLLELNSIEVPSALVSQEIGRLREQLAQQMPEEMREKAVTSEMLPDDMFAEEAGRRVTLGLVMGEIIKKDDIKATDDDVRAHVESMAASYENPEAVVEYYMSNQEFLENVQGVVVEELVTQKIVEHAEVSDKPMTFQEIMNPAPPEAEAETETEQES